MLADMSCNFLVTGHLLTYLISKHPQKEVKVKYVNIVNIKTGLDTLFGETKHRFYGNPQHLFTIEFRCLDDDFYVKFDLFFGTFSRDIKL